MLAQIVELNSIMSLNVVRCALDNTSFHVVLSALKHNTHLSNLVLWDNSLNEVSVRKLADDLEHNNKLRRLDVTKRTGMDRKVGSVLDVNSSTLSSSTCSCERRMSNIFHRALWNECVD